MASWFTRALDVATPWNRRGEVQRRQERKKKEENTTSFQSSSPTLKVSTARPTQNVVVDSPKSAPQPQRPDNLFQDLNKSLMIGKRNNVLDIMKNQDTAPAPKPQPGSVVTPTLKVTSAPTQRLKLPDGRYADEIPDTPEQIIDRGLNEGKSWEQIARDNNYNLDGVREYSQATRPNYGIKIEKPKQSFGNRFRDIFDTNTEADKWRRQEGNKKLKDGEQEKAIVQEKSGNIISRTPIVGHVTKMLNTGGAQIAQLIPTIGNQFATRELTAATKEYSDAVKSGDKVKIAKAKQRVNDASNRVSDYNAQQDAAATMFQKNDGGLFNAGTLYDEEASKRGDIKTGAKDIVLPTAVTMLDLYTLGQGAAIEQAIKEGGLRVGARVAAPNIVKAGAGNFASGAGSTISEGGNAQDAVKAGAINSVLGLVPDVGLPALGRSVNTRLLPKIFKGKPVNAGDVINEIDDAGISASAEAANQALKPRPIKVVTPKDIAVDIAESAPENIPVKTPPKPKPTLIKELEGDFKFKPMEELQQIRVDEAKKAADAFNSSARPDPMVEGITPRKTEPYKLSEEAVKGGQDKLIDEYASFLKDVGEGNGTQLVPDGEGGYYRTSNNVRFGDTKGRRMTKADWRDEAERQLRSGQADPSIQKAFDDAADPELQSLLAKGEQPDAPVGAPIKVKEVKSIPVTDQTVVPTNLPETPGQVRATTQTSPMAAKTEAVANAPVTTSPGKLPAETQAILDNPRQFNKRQVQAARNQRKMARAVAKAQEDTVAAMDRINTASPAAQSGEGFVQTGEFGKSAQGGAYQKVSRAAEMQQAIQETSQMSPGDVLQTARKNQLETGGFNRRDIRNVAALFESKRIPRGTPEWEEARAILKEDGTVWGQTGALRNYTMRRTASATELMNRYESKIYRLADDPTKIDSKLFDQVEAAEEAYTQARDEALAAYNRFTESPTSANAKAYHAAQDAADKADKAAKITEYKVADKTLKGNKDIKQVRELEKMANEADMYQMDAVDASMLSGTATFIRNFVNAAVGGVEEGIFGKPAAWISSKLTRQSVGGGVGRGTLKGFGDGVENIVDASKARASNAGWNPLSHLKNWSTTGNQLGDSIIDSQITRNTLDHYTQVLKEQGYKGRELVDRASVMARQDPDNMARVYASTARTAAGLGAGVTRGNKIETIVKNIISDTISAGNPGRLSEGTAKLITRMTIGFPTAIGRSAVEGVKRFTLGAPTFVKALATKDPQMRAILMKEGLKQAGTGSMVIPPLFYAMGANGLITGSYPSDPEERARWEREGITENSIKIDGAYYQLPAYLGSWAIPGLFYASLGRNDGDFKAAAADAAKIVPALLPTDQASNVMDAINGRTDMGKFMAQTGASAVRAVTPAGALLNQLAKSFDPTKNDTNSGTNIENFVDKVLSGIPGVNNMANIPDKKDDAGNVISNPNAAQLLFGASSASQSKGEERSANITANIDNSLQSMADTGAFADPNLKSVLEDDTLQIYNKAINGEKLGQKDLKKLQEALVKGVSSTGDDTAYLEREQYDSNLTALRLKRELMNADKATKPSDIKKMDIAIKRGEIYRDGEIPYDLIDAYQTIGIDEWRKMGDPEDDAYDPDMYQKLWAIDERMAKAGVSYKKGALDKQKYSAKKQGSGRRGGSGSSANFSSEFGKLKAGAFAPEVRQYQTIDAQSGSVPVIKTVRPNIVHKIGSSG